MYTIHPIPSIQDAFVYKFVTEQEAVDAARAMAEKYKVEVVVREDIRRFNIEVREINIERI